MTACVGASVCFLYMEFTIDDDDDDDYVHKFLLYAPEPNGISGQEHEDNRGRSSCPFDLPLQLVLTYDDYSYLEHLYRTYPQALSLLLFLF